MSDLRECVFRAWSEYNSYEASEECATIVRRSQLLRLRSELYAALGEMGTELETLRAEEDEGLQ